MQDSPVLPDSAARPDTGHRGGELFLFCWISTLGLGGCVLLFCLDQGAAAAAVTAAMTSVLGMLGWRQARPPQG